MQGGNIGEGPGWGPVILGAWLIASAVLGTVIAVGTLILRGRMVRRQPDAGAIVSGYLLALPASAGLAALWATGGIWSAVIALSAGLAAFYAVLYRRWS